MKAFYKLANNWKLLTFNTGTNNHKLFVIFSLMTPFIPARIAIDTLIANYYILDFNSLKEEKWLFGIVLLIPATGHSKNRALKNRFVFKEQ